MAIQRLYIEGCLDGSMPDWNGRWQCSGEDFKKRSWASVWHSKKPWPTPHQSLPKES